MSEPGSPPNSWSSGCSQSTDDGTDEFVGQGKSSIQEVGDGASLEQSTSRTRYGGGAAAELVNPVDPPLPHEYGEPRPAGVQESAAGSRGPSAYPASNGHFQEDLFGQQVKDMCQQEIESKPFALGLIVLIANTVAAGFMMLPQIPGVLEGVKKMKEAFMYLGYAILSLPRDLTDQQLKTAIKVVASVDFPISYRRLFVYITGHGGSNFVCTSNECVDLKDIIEPFVDKRTADFDRIPKVFIFDMCNNHSDALGTTQADFSQYFPSFPETMGIFAVLTGRTAYATDNDCGLLTRHLAPMLQKCDKSLSDVVTDTSAALQKEIMRHPEWNLTSDYMPVVCHALTKPIHLLSERRRAMTPGTPQIQLHRTHITVRASFPPSHKHFELDRLTVRCAGTDCETEKEVNDRSNGNVRIDGLKPPNSYQLTTAAYYPDDEVILSTSRTHQPAHLTHFDMISRTCQNNIRWFVIYLVLSLLLAGGIVGGIVGIVFTAVDSKPKTSELGFAGDIIIVGEANSWWRKAVMVTECPLTGDGKYYPPIYVVNKKNIASKLHEYDHPVFSLENAFLPDPSCVTLPTCDNCIPYLLWQSNITANICLASTNISTVSYPVDVSIYKTNKADGECLTTNDNMQLKVGANNQTLCSLVNLTISKPGYYYVSLKASGMVTYSYNIYYHVVYFNIDEFKNSIYCTKTSESDQCDVHLKAINQDYVLLAPIKPHPPPVPYPLTTHICSEYQNSYKTLIIMCFFFFILCCIFAFCICTYYRKRQRQNFMNTAP